LNPVTAVRQWRLGFFCFRASRPAPRRRHSGSARLYCSICHRRLSGTTIRNNTYYRCPHEPGNPRHYAAHPGHRTVSVREDLMMDAFTQFFTEVPI